MANGHDHDYPEDRVPADLLTQMGYETRDVGPKAIITWIAGLFVFVGIVSFGILALENVFVPETGQVAYQSEFYRTQPIRNEPPMPQLQTLPKRDMIMYRKDENRSLHGNVELPNGKISIPVEQAIDQLAAEGISGVTGEAPKPDTSGYPGSGKYLTAEPKTVEAPAVETPKTDGATEQKEVQGGHSTTP